MTYRQSVFLVRAVHRARWLADLDAALSEASRITARFGVIAGGSEARALRARIDALHRDVDSFRRMRCFAHDIVRSTTDELTL